MSFLLPAVFGGAGAAGAGAAAGAGLGTLTGAATVGTFASGLTAAGFPVAAGIGTGAAAAGAGLGLGTILSAAGLGMSAMGAIQQGNAADAAARYNAQIARQNAILTRQAAEENERRFRVNARKQAGASRVAYGKSGVTLEGSPSDILEEQAYIAELDALTIRQEGRQTAGAYDSEAFLSESQGKTQKRQSYYKAASSVLAGGADLYTNWPA